MGSECFRCAELLFRPSLMGLDTPGLAQVAYSAIQACDMDLRREFYGNVVLSGGCRVPQAAHVGAGARLAFKAGNPVLIVAGAQWRRGGWVLRGAEMGPACSRCGMWGQEAAALQRWIAVLGFGWAGLGLAAAGKGWCRRVLARPCARTILAPDQLMMLASHSRQGQPPLSAAPWLWLQAAPRCFQACNRGWRGS